MNITIANKLFNDNNIFFKSAVFNIKKVKTTRKRGNLDSPLKLKPYAKKPLNDSKR